VAGQSRGVLFEWKICVTHVDVCMSSPRIHPSPPPLEGWGWVGKGRGLGIRPVAQALPTTPGSRTTRKLVISPRARF
jgi:hypothetical protein